MDIDCLNCILLYFELLIRIILFLEIIIIKFLSLNDLIIVQKCSVIKDKEVYYKYRYNIFFYYNYVIIKIVFLKINTILLFLFSQFLNLSFPFI